MSAPGRLQADGAREHVTGVLGSRPGVVRVGTLIKEGGTQLSRAFPSKRFFCLLSVGRLEYYEEKSIRLPSSSNGSEIASVVELNDWNLVVFVHAQLGVAIGDIVLTIDGSTVSGGDFSAAIGKDRPTAHTLTLLRPKGEVPVRGALVEGIGGTRLRITVSRRELIDSRPPYVLIAPNSQSRDEWLQAVQMVAHTTRDEASGRAASPGWSESSYHRDTIEMAIEAADAALPLEGIADNDRHVT